MAGRTVDSIKVGLGLDIAEIRSQRDEVKRILRELATGPDSRRVIKVTAKVEVDTRVLNRAQATIQDHMRRVMGEINRTGLRITPRITVSQQSVRDLARQVEDQLRTVGRGQGIRLPAKIQFSAADARRATTEIQNAMAQAGPVKIGFDWYWINPPPGGGGAGPGGGGGGPAGPAGGGGPRAPRTSPRRAAPPPPAASPPPAPAAPPPAGGTGSTVRQRPVSQPRPARQTVAPPVTNAPNTVVTRDQTAQQRTERAIGGVSEGGRYATRSQPLPRLGSMRPRNVAIPQAVTDEIGPTRGVRGARLAAPGVTAADRRRLAMQRTRGTQSAAMLRADELAEADRRRFENQDYQDLIESLRHQAPHPDADTQEILDALNMWSTDPNAAAAKARAIKTRMMGSSLSDEQLAALPRSQRSMIRRRGRFWPKVWSGRASSDRADPDTGRIEPRQPLLFFQAQALAALGAETAMIRNPGRANVASNRGRPARRSTVRDFSRDRRDTSEIDPAILAEDMRIAEAVRSRAAAQRASAGNPDLSGRGRGGPTLASSLPFLILNDVRRVQGLIPGASPRLLGIERAMTKEHQQRLMGIRRRAGAMGPFPEEWMFAGGGKYTRVYKAGEAGWGPYRNHDFLRQSNGLGAFVTGSRKYAEGYLPEAALYADATELQRSRARARGMIHEGTALTSSIARRPLMDAFGSYPGIRDSWEGLEYATQQPNKYIVNHLAGPKGKLPGFANGGTVNLDPGKGRSLRFRHGIGQYRDATGELYSMRMGWGRQLGEQLLNVTHRPSAAWRRYPGERVPAGAIHIKLGDEPGTYRDVNPFIEGSHQKRGLATAAYTMLEHMGIPVEAMSNTNATGVFNFAGHYQTAAGSRFWQSRKRRQGWSQDEIAAAMSLGSLSRGHRAEFQDTLGKLTASGKPFHELGRPTPPRIYSDGELAAEGVLNLDSRGRMNDAPIGRSFAGGGLYSSRMPAPYWSGGKYPPNAQHPDAILVGERGPEVMVPTQSAYIIPNHMRGQLESQSRNKRQGMPKAMAEDIWMNSRNLPRGWAAGGVNTPRFAAGVPGGLGGRFMGAADRAEMAAMQRAAAIAQTGGAATPVMVTNWPQGLTSAGNTAGMQQQIQQLTATLRAQQQQQTAANRPNTRANQPVQNAPPGNQQGQQQGQQTPPGPGPSPAVPRGTITPLQRARARQAGRAAGTDFRDEIGAISSNITEALQSAPARALSVAFGQIAQNAIGGRSGILERARVASGLAGRAQRTSSAFEEAQGGVERGQFQLAQLRARAGTFSQGRNETPQAFAQRLASSRTNILEEIRQQRSAATFLKGQAEQDVAAAREASEKIVTRPQKIRALGVSAAAIGVGTLGFTAIMQAFQLGIQGVTAVLGPAADAMRGFAGVATDSQKELSDAIRSAGGNTGAAGGAFRARIGLSSDVNLRGLTSAAERQTQLENLTSQIDALRSSGFFDRQGARGVGQGLGNGPFAGTPFDIIGQTQGLDQLLSERLFQGPGGLRQGISAADLDRAVGPGGLAGLFGNGADRDTIDTLQRNITAGYGDVAAQTEQLSKLYDKYGLSNQKLTEASNKKLDYINAQLKKSGEDQRFGAVSKERSTATAEALRGVGLSGLADIFQAGGIGVTGGGQINAQAIADALLKSSQFADPRALLDQNKAGLTAQARGIQRGLAFQQGTVIPAGIFQQQITNPIASSAGQGLDARAVGSDVIRRIGALRSEYQKLGDTGRQAMLDLGVTPEQIKGVEELGTQIRDINEQSQNMQLAYEQIQYNRQLFVTRRQLSDIVGLQGKGSVSVNGQVIQASKLGQLQRQQLEDSREQAKISLAANRREIEFNIALSRLNTPGSTPAERATRRHEADLIAAEQRRQLQLNERQTRTGFAIQDIQISRDAKDAIYALQDLQRGRQLTLQLRGNEKIAEAAQILQQARLEGLNASRDAGIQTKQLMLNTVASIEEASNDFTGNVEKEVKAVFKTIVTNAKQAYSDFLKESGAAPAEDQYAGAKATASTHSGEHFAKGWNAYVSSPTRFMAGDAGGEQVLILRNPRAGTLPSGGGGGGGMMFAPVININGATVREEHDVQKIARQVAKAINEEAMLLGVTTRT